MKKQPLQIGPRSFEARLKKAKPYISLLSVFTGITKQVTAKCSTCEATFTQTADSLVRYKAKCDCVHTKQQPLRTTHEEFVAKLKATGKPIKLLDRYAGVSTPMRVFITTCGHEDTGTPNQMLHGRSTFSKTCKACALAKGPVKGTHEEFITDLKSKHPNIKVLESYVSRTRPIKLRCMKDGHEWSAPAHHVLSAKHGCAMCAQLETGYAFKNVTIKGKTFRVQGDEPFFLEWMAKRYPKLLKELWHGAEVPSITYEDRSPNHGRLINRVYRPDFFIPSMNLIVEIKSTYTAAGKPAWFRNLKRKRQATIDAGYNFQLLIFSRDGDKMKLADRWWEHQLTSKTIASLSPA